MGSTTLYLAAILIWGSTWYAIKLQLGWVEPIVSVAWRFALAAVLLMAWCTYRKLPMRFNPSAHVGMALLGLFLFSSNYAIFYYASVNLTSGLVAVIFSTIVILNIIGGALFLSNRITAPVVIGALTGIIGLGMIFLPDLARFDSFGVTLAFIGTGLASIGNIVSARIQRRDIPVVQANAYGMSYGAIFLFITVWWFDIPLRFELTPAYTGSLIYLAVFGSILAFGSYLTLVGRVGPGRAAYAMVLFPIVALLLSTLLEDYRWTALSITGVALVLIGNYIIIGPGAATNASKRKVYSTS